MRENARSHRSTMPHRSRQFKKVPDDEGATCGVTERNGTIGYIDEFPSGRRAPLYDTRFGHEG